MSWLGILEWVVVWYVALVLLTDLIAMLLQLLIVRPVGVYTIPYVVLVAIVAVLTAIVVIPKVWVMVLYNNILAIVVNSKMLIDKYSSKRE